PVPAHLVNMIRVPGRCEESAHALPGPHDAEHCVSHDCLLSPVLACQVVAHSPTVLPLMSRIGPADLPSSSAPATRRSASAMSDRSCIASLPSVICSVNSSMISLLSCLIPVNRKVSAVRAGRDAVPLSPFLRLVLQPPAQRVGVHRPVPGAFVILVSGHAADERPAGDAQRIREPGQERLQVLRVPEPVG